MPISDNFPLHYVKQVEVVYGPGSALYGADAMTGVINLITHSPEEMDSVSMTVDAGNFGDRRFTLNGGKELTDNIAVSLYGHVQQADNYDVSKDFESFTLGDLTTFDGTTVVAAGDRQGFRADTKSYSVGGKLLLGENLTVGAHQSYFRNPGDTGALPNTTNYDANANIHTKQTSVYAKYNAELTDALSATFSTGYLHFEMDDKSKFSNIFTNFDDGYKYTEGQRSYGEVQVDYELDENDQFIAGAIFENMGAIPKTADMNHPFNHQTGTFQGHYVGTDGTLPIRIFEIDYTNMGGFAQWEHK